MHHCQERTSLKFTKIKERKHYCKASAPVICIPCHTTYGDNVRGNDLLSSPAVPGKCRACVLRKYTPMKFTLIKSRAMTLSRSLQSRAFSRAVMDEKLLSPLFPVGGGAVVTNDWCTTCNNGTQFFPDTCSIFQEGIFP